MRPFRLPADDLEYAVLTALWQLGTASVRDLHERLGVPQGLAYTTTAKLAHARLIGDSRALRERVSRLLSPLPQSSPGTLRRIVSLERAALLLVPVLLTAVTLGVVYGESVMRALLGLTS